MEKRNVLFSVLILFMLVTLCQGVLAKPGHRVSVAKKDHRWSYVTRAVARYRYIAYSAYHPQTCEEFTKNHYGVDGNVCRVSRYDKKYSRYDLGPLKNCVFRGRCKQPSLDYAPGHADWKSTGICKGSTCRYTITIGHSKSFQWSHQSKAAIVVKVGLEGSISKTENRTRSVSYALNCGQELKYRGQLRDLVPDNTPEDQKKNFLFDTEVINHNCPNQSNVRLSTPWSCKDVNQDMQLTDKRWYRAAKKPQQAHIARRDVENNAVMLFNETKNNRYLKPLKNGNNVSTVCQVLMKQTGSYYDIYEYTQALKSGATGGTKAVTIKPQAKQNLCLEAVGTVNNGSAVLLQKCAGNNNRQKWFKDSQGRYRNGGNKAFCLNITHGNIKANNWVRMNQCGYAWGYKYNGKTKEFKPNKKGWGGQCIDVKNSQFKPDAKVWVYQCNKGNAQKWVIK